MFKIIRMNTIEQIYLTDFGVAFYWRKEDEVLRDRIQIVFKETGFYLSIAEIKKFSEMILDACQKNECASCCHRDQCHKFLLKTPLRQIDLAVSAKELSKIKELIEGTLFYSRLHNYINGPGLN